MRDEDDIDHLVVGAGTAGCVLAARLSEDPSRRVVVLEAGPDFPTEADLPPSLRDGAGEGYDAGLTATVCAGRVDRVARGRVVGGSSQVNACGALRAPAADYDAWARLGLPAWSWQHVLASFRRLESDLDYPDSPYHGAHGPVPIIRPGPTELTTPMAGFLEATVDAGNPYRADMNAPDAYGIGPYPQNRRGRLRMSTNLTHLAPARADRPNLTVHADTTVEHVVIRHGRAVGVQASGRMIPAREVVLCAGAPFTPAILLRSGIGPAGELAEAGVSALVDLPGVGRGLYDQPGAVIPAIPREGTVDTDAPMLTQLIARLDGLAGRDVDGAFYLNLFTGPDPYAAHPVSAIMIGDLTPRSRGTVTLAADPTLSPQVDLGFYTAPGDLDRMMAAYRHAWSIAQRPAFAGTVSGFSMVDDEMVGDDEALAGALRAMTFSRLTLLGGAAMGPDRDRDAVVDEHCRVRGVDALRVVDLSVVPVALRATTALDAMMLGEHTAAWVAAGR